ncbi:MAG: hypothetical protein DBY11_00460 [Eggerthellales bacterium]|nr:MAG: hypothetical protein DBY11_00460 [Eggerthellales bacterium]
MQRSYNPFKRFMLGGGGVQPASASRMSSLGNKTREQFALSFEFLVGCQKFMRVTNVLISALAMQVKACEATT